MQTSRRPTPPAQAITAALLARGRGAGGQHLSIAMLDAALAFYWPGGMTDKTHVPQSMAPLRVIDLYHLVDTADGKIVDFAASAKQFEGVWRAFGRIDLAEDPRFTDMRLISAEPSHLIEVGRIIRESFGSFSTADIVQRMAEHSVPCAPVLSRADVPTTRRSSITRPSSNGSTRNWAASSKPRPPVKFSLTPANIRLDLSTAGANTDEVLAAIGYEPERIARLRDSSVIR